VIVVKTIMLVLLLTVSLLLMSCFGSPASVPEDRFYTLRVETAERFANKYKRIAINKVYAYGIYNERAFLYANAELPLQIKRYHYHHWATPPTQLIQHAFKDYLSQSHIAKDVVVQAVSSDADLRISGKILAFERVVQSAKKSVHVELEFEVYWANGQHRVFHYTQNITAKKDTLHATAEAYGVALGNIFKEFLTAL